MIFIFFSASSIEVLCISVSKQQSYSKYTTVYYHSPHIVSRKFLNNFSDMSQSKNEKDFFNVPSSLLVI